MAGPIADIYSRKYSISGWCVIFILGVAIQTGGNYNVATMYAGRWFAGMGVGALSMLVPMYNAELAPPGIRGSLVALQQLAITFGILVSYWIAYGTNCKSSALKPPWRKSDIYRHWRLLIHLSRHDDWKRFRSKCCCVANPFGNPDGPCYSLARWRSLPPLLPSMAYVAR
jgi:MFS family permease